MLRPQITFISELVVQQYDSLSGAVIFRLMRYFLNPGILPYINGVVGHEGEAIGETEDEDIKEFDTCLLLSNGFVIKIKELRHCKFITITHHCPIHYTPHDIELT